MVTRKLPQNIDRNGISPQFELTVGKCKDEYIGICILKIMDRTSEEQTVSNFLLDLFDISHPCAFEIDL